MMSHMLLRPTYFFSISRNIHSTSVLNKQRDLALRRHLRKYIPPYHKEQFIYDGFVTKPYDYPEPIPKIPPGNWGDIEPKTAWKW